MPDLRAAFQLQVQHQRHQQHHQHQYCHQCTHRRVLLHPRVRAPLAAAVELVTPWLVVCSTHAADGLKRVRNSRLPSHTQLMTRLGCTASGVLRWQPAQLPPRSLPLPFRVLSPGPLTVLHHEIRDSTAAWPQLFSIAAVQLLLGSHARSVRVHIALLLSIVVDALRVVVVQVRLWLVVPVCGAPAAI